MTKLADLHTGDTRVAIQLDGEQGEGRDTGKAKRMSRTSWTESLISSLAKDAEQAVGYVSLCIQT